MTAFITLTPTTTPVGTKQLHVAVSEVESVRTPEHGRHAQALVKMKSGDEHFVDESVDNILAMMAVAGW